MPPQAPLQGRVSTFADVQAQPNYQALDPGIQAQIALDYFDKRVATQPGYQQAPAEAQQAMKQDFIQQYNISTPNPAPVVGLTPRQPAQPVQAPQWLQELPDELGYAAATTVLPFATAAKAYTMDYPWLDAETPLLGYARGIEEKYPEAFAHDPRRIDSPYSQAGRMVSYGAGMLKNFKDIGGLAERGLKGAGRALLPYTSTAAAEGWPLLSQASRMALKGLSRLQAESMLSTAAKGATEFGLYEGLKSHPENQFDFGQRANDALHGAAMGAVMNPSLELTGKLAGKALAPVGKLAGEALGNTGKTLQGSIKAIQELTHPSGMWMSGVNEQVATLLQRLGELLNHPGITESEAKVVEQSIRRIIKEQSEGRIPKGLPKLGKQVKTLEGRARFREKLGKTRIIEAPDATKMASTATQPAIPVEAESALSSYDPRFKQGRIVFTEDSIRHLTDNPDRMKYIQQGGYSSPEEFLEDIAKNFDAIYENTTSKGEKRLLIAKNKKQAASLVLEIAPDGQGDYKMITAFPTNPRYLSNKKLLWERNDTLSTESLPLGRSGQSSNPQNSTSTTTPQPSNPVKLSGSVKEMVDQVAESVGMKADDLVAAKPKDLTPAQKDARTNIMAVQKSEAINPDLGILRQQPVNEERQLLFGQVEEAVPEEFQGIAGKINEAIEKDKAIRVEYIAEETGRSNEAAKVTAKGNVKVETTTFTPTFWSQTKDGRVMVQGYNQRGHFVSYHLAPSESGSQVLKAGKLVDTPFRGEYPNRIYGQREFRAEDILKRGTRSAEGPVLTSEAMSKAQQTGDILKLIQNSPSLSDKAKKIATKMAQKKKVNEMELMVIEKELGSKEKLQEFCKLFGL